MVVVLAIHFGNVALCWGVGARTEFIFLDKGPVSLDFGSGK